MPLLQQASPEYMKLFSIFFPFLKVRNLFTLADLLAVAQ